MKLFSSCSDCEHCILHYSLCLAGPGDDDFSPVTLKGCIEVMTNDYISDDVKRRLQEAYPEWCAKSGVVIGKKG